MGRLEPEETPEPTCRPHLEWQRGQKYTQKQLDFGIAFATALDRGALVLCEPPEG